MLLKCDGTSNITWHNEYATYRPLRKIIGLTPDLGNFREYLHKFYNFISTKIESLI